MKRVLMFCKKCESLESLSLACLLGWVGCFCTTNSLQSGHSRGSVELLKVKGVINPVTFLRKSSNQCAKGSLSCWKVLRSNLDIVLFLAPSLNLKDKHGGRHYQEPKQLLIFHTDGCRPEVTADKQGHGDFGDMDFFLLQKGTSVAGMTSYKARSYVSNTVVSGDRPKAALLLVHNAVTMHSPSTQPFVCVACPSCFLLQMVFGGGSTL